MPFGHCDTWAGKYLVTEKSGYSPQNQTEKCLVYEFKQGLPEGRPKVYQETKMEASR